MSESSFLAILQNLTYYKKHDLQGVDSFFCTRMPKKQTFYEYWYYWSPKQR